MRDFHAVCVLLTRREVNRAMMAEIPGEGNVRLSAHLARGSLAKDVAERGFTAQEAEASRNRPL